MVESIRNAADDDADAAAAVDVVAIYTPDPGGHEDMMSVVPTLT